MTPEEIIMEAIDRLTDAEFLLTYPRAQDLARAIPMQIQLLEDALPTYENNAPPSPTDIYALDFATQIVGEQ